MDEKIKLPNVFDYLDIILFLQDYYKSRKQMKEGFSYQQWSEELGFNSRSFLRMIITGKKKVTGKFTAAFSEIAFSGKEEKDYFVHMVSYCQGPDPKTRQFSGQQMIKILSLRSTVKMVDADKRFISSTLLPRLLSLLGYRDIQGTASYYAKIMNKDLAEIQTGLEVLKEMGLADSIENNQQTVWFSLTEAFKVSDQKGDFDLMKFHEQSLMEAISAFSKPKEQRRYKSLLLQMTADELQDFNRVVDEFTQAVISKFTTKSCIGKKMYQTNFNIYPVSEVIEPTDLNSEKAATN